MAGLFTSSHPVLHEPHRLHAPAMRNLTPTPPEARTIIPDFTPVARKYRHDGWTPERQRAFIQALAATGSVTAAANRINMSSEGAYVLRHQPGAEGFAAAWAAALDHGVQHLTDLAIDRATHGTPVPVFWKGEQVGERRRYNDRLLMFILKHHIPGQYGGTALPPPRSLEQIAQDAADNCPVCKEREEQQQQALKDFPAKWLTELFERYRGKIQMERRYRLSGQIIAADFTLRQLTHIELMMSMGGRSTDMLDLWSTEDGKRANFHNEIFADPISATLDDIRQKVWARQDGGLERPALPHQHRKLPPTYGPCLGDTLPERKTARLRAQARIAEAQAEWEATWDEESWAAWRASRSE